LRIYNTLTNQKEELRTIEDGRVRIYACGPTVYNLIHIGNARPLCVFDVLRRYLEWRGWDVRYIQNFTDIDDKIIRRANEEGVAFDVIAERYIEEYWKDAKGLNVKEATEHPKATENIDEIISIISELVEKGYAYVAENGDVYFRTGKFEEYGKLSHQPLEDLESGARIDVSDLKEDAMDFALWKAAKPGEPCWKSPWSDGRPGWHIECSAMARRYLGKTIDIHGGGQDLIFPHHENEIAQSECCNGVPFANYWMHNGYINVDNRKMSKSLGNFFTVRDVAGKYGYEPIRFFLISSSYRSPINYSPEIIEQGISALDRLYTCRQNLEFAIKNTTQKTSDAAPGLIQGFTDRRAQFIRAMDDDLNTADAIAALFELVRDINVALTESPSLAALEKALEIFDELTGVLGLLYERRQDDEPDGIVEEMIARRAEARSQKNWAESDRIRDELKAMGIVLEDTPQGVKWHRV
jgi:cysteinyl-tRNA synthetase